MKIEKLSTLRARVIETGLRVDEANAQCFASDHSLPCILAHQAALFAWDEAMMKAAYYGIRATEGGAE